MSIKPLPGDVVAKIKSSAVVTSLNGVAAGLLQNSLDADATRINVSVDYSKGNCAVEDDGLGIAPGSFRADGGLVRLHSTSKYPPEANRHGRHGAFLASVAALSLLSITSHHHEYLSHNSMTIHNSKVVARNIPALPEQRLVSFSHGTRVTVRDLFGSLPVRVKQRASDIERAGSVRDFDQLVRHTIAFLLAWPGHVSIALRDATGRKVVTLRTSELTTISRQGSTEGRLLRTRTHSLLAQASLYDAGNSKAWVPVEVSAGHVTVAGCISLVPAATKHMQFISLGILPLLNEHHSNVLYEDFNRVFSRSSFGVVEDEEVLDLRKGANPVPRKGIDRWPVFCLTVTRSGVDADGVGDVDDLLNGQRSGLSSILKLLRTTAYEFLKKHHLRPRAIDTLGPPHSSWFRTQDALQEVGDCTPSRTRSPTKERESSRTPQYQVQTPADTDASTPQRRPSPPISAWSKMKSGRPVLTNSGTGGSGTSHTRHPSVIGTHGSHDRASSTAPLSLKRPRLVEKWGKLTRKPFDDEDTQEAAPVNTSRSSPKGPEDDGAKEDNLCETLVWVDPTTKIRSLVNARTGFVLDHKRRRLTLAPSKLTTDDTVNPSPAKKPWLDDMLAQWKNPVFESTEPRIPCVPELPEAAGSCGHGGCHAPSAVALRDADNPTTLGAPERISRQGLLKAKVIAQVDRKFILATVPRDPPQPPPYVCGDLPDDQAELLLVIDQHAADERIRLEALMASYFAVDRATGTAVACTRPVDKPLRFDLPAREGDLVMQHRAHFERWGIFFEVFAGDSSRTVTVAVQSLPPSISERCRLESRLVVEILRREVWRLHERPALAVGHAGVENGEEGKSVQPWVARFSGCPEGVWELLASRSCRSAIMFNDELSLPQCRDMVARLTACAFPFQCAHGRPSMLPLVALEGREAALGGVGERRWGGNVGEGESEGQGDGELWGKLRQWSKGRERSYGKRGKQGKGK